LNLERLLSTLFRLSSLYMSKGHWSCCNLVGSVACWLGLFIRMRPVGLFSIFKPWFPGHNLMVQGCCLFFIWSCSSAGSHAGEICVVFPGIKGRWSLCVIANARSCISVDFAWPSSDSFLYWGRLRRVLRETAACWPFVAHTAAEFYIEHFGYVLFPNSEGIQLLAHLLVLFKEVTSLR
jgi:hypothetical protein